MTMPSDLPRLLSLKTAVPPHRIEQTDVRKWARGLFNGRVRDVERLLPAFDNAGINFRHSCMPLEWFSEAKGWQEKNAQYLAHAVDLLAAASEDAIADAGLMPEDIDAVVTVSTTGISTPSLDARLFNRLPFRAETTRLPIFGLGCAGGVAGVARAAELATARPGANILLLVVELCGLTFRGTDLSKSNVIATALFGDGAAAAVISTDAPDDAPAVTHWGEHTWPDSLGVMGWTVEEDGLGVVFSRDIPRLVETELPPVLEKYLNRAGQTLSDISWFTAHPGGAKVIEALEKVFGVQTGGLSQTRHVLQNFGNMSAASVMFVLARALEEGFGRNGRSERALMSALGPGFSAGFVTLEASAGGTA